MTTQLPFLPLFGWGPSPPLPVYLRITLLYEDLLANGSPVEERGLTVIRLPSEVALHGLICQTDPDAGIAVALQAKKGLGVGVGDFVAQFRLKSALHNSQILRFSSVFTNRPLCSEQ